MASLEDMLRSFALLSSAPAELPALGKVNGAFDRQIFLLRCEEEEAACNRPATSYFLTGMLSAVRKAGDTEWARKIATYARENPDWTGVEALLLALARAGDGDAPSEWAGMERALPPVARVNVSTASGLRQAFESSLIIPFLRAGAHLQREADTDGTKPKDDKWASEALALRAQGVRFTRAIARADIRCDVRKHMPSDDAWVPFTGRFSEFLAPVYGWVEASISECKDSGSIA
eukprot:g2188.t1